MKVSIIIPCYNAVDKVGRCLASLRAIDMPRADYEVLFIDDCSTDGTPALLQQECAKETNWRVQSLEANSGSPSRPRNRGMEQAAGDYVFFLDCDDEIMSDTLRVQHAHAVATQADVVRGYLLVDDGNGRTVRNRLDKWQAHYTRRERVQEIIARQSTTPPCLIRASLLSQHELLWPEEIRIGEDTVFLASVLAVAERIEYIAHATYVYNKRSALTASSTSVYGGRELRDHLIVWNMAQTLLQQQGVDYVSSRLQIGLQTALSAMIFRNCGDIDAELFQKFGDFLREHWSAISGFNYVARYKEVLAAVHAGDYWGFRQRCRPRLLIAGHDLKFIISLLPELGEHFDVRIDEWRGHNQHNEEQSHILLNWAELIWCEWLLGNAVWYAEHKRTHQRLVVRMHRMELGREFGDQLPVDEIDAVVAVSVHFLERLLERFSNIPRAKARLLPNYVHTADYRRDFHEDRLYTLGLIGILPARKGLQRALNILVRLREQDTRYRLEIFGKQPEEVPWVARDGKETAYFEECRAFIRQQGLQDAVVFHGHSDVKTVLAEKRVGIILSTSDSELEFPGPESFHVAVADGFAAGGVSLILDWIGAEYIWPKEFILPSEEAIVQRIRLYSDTQQEFEAASERGRRFIEERYGADALVRSIKSLFEELPALGVNSMR